ncbi:putative homocitrate synthase [Diaporthe ampelina]|uniref:Putative homocitrate synthase n=1 Tax=Diaporthe ampelina TaxID=1214573 RepID=A0A0G2I9U6_9PEZI|nr:putative homocitrate synthase [Diaporthe ampelina]
MPLHLLGKKSWNVYNADNIARVQRDEAAAAAEEQAAEQRMQDADAARRLAILRGETPPPLPEPEQPADPADRKHARRSRDHTLGGGPAAGQRKRKRAGEDDTDFEMRVARERAEEGARVADELAAGGSKRQKLKGKEGEGEGEVSIVDSRGHIDLFGPPPKDAGGGGGGGGDGGAKGKMTDRERESKRKTQELVDKHTKSFNNGDLAGKPWYEDEKRRHAANREWWLNAVAAAVTSGEARPEEEDREAERCMEAPTTNVWGRGDPKRRGRETARLDANDPLAAMKSGSKKVRDILKERRREAEERLRDLEQLRQEERRRRREKLGKRERGRTMMTSDTRAGAPTSMARSVDGAGKLSVPETGKATDTMSGIRKDLVKRGRPHGLIGARAGTIAMTAVERNKQVATLEAEGTG